MDQPTKIEFKVDEKYENEKGVFRVISIQKDQMVIRWKNGQEIRTGIELQRNIAERRLWEKQNPSDGKKATGKSSTKYGLTGKKNMFTGFAPTDFKKSASGTTWRSRSQLGAAVSQKIDTSLFTFNSWAFGHKSEMHLQDIEHHSRTTNDYPARFFVRVDQQALHYGFRVARPDNKEGALTDWDAFCKWLNQPENEQILRTIAVKDNLSACNRISPSAGTLLASGDGWRTDKGRKLPDKETLATYINDTSETEPFDLEIEATIAKSDAVECGPDIAAKIAHLFTQLLPLYEAAVTR